jgi:hypothetical protein
MNQFFQRVANYVGNEIIVKGLAESKAFQRFAVRSNKTYEDYAKQGTEKLNETIEELAKQAGTPGAATSASAKEALKGPPTPPLTGFPGFVSAFFKEIRKDITGTT